MNSNKDDYLFSILPSSFPSRLLPQILHCPNLVEMCTVDNALQELVRHYGGRPEVAEECRSKTSGRTLSAKLVQSALKVGVLSCRLVLFQDRPLSLTFRLWRVGHGDMDEGGGAAERAADG